MSELPHIPQAAPALRIARYRSEIEDAFGRFLDGPQYILGGIVEQFEEAFAAYHNVKYCVAVANGTDALILGLRAVGVGLGDEVITPSLTASPTAQAILLSGAKPRFVDVDAKTRCLDPDSVEAAVTERTKAILAVHLFGHPAEMMRINNIAERHGVKVIEDCAQSHGSTIQGRKVGAFGDIGAFSFYPTKNLGALGDGGAIITSNAEYASKVRLLRNHGWDENRICIDVSGNSRLDALQAAILLVMLPHLDEGNAERCEIAATYRRHLENSPVELPEAHDGHIYHQFAIATDRREELARALLRQSGVHTGIQVYPPLHKHPVFTSFSPEPLHVTEALADKLLCLPIQPEVASPHAEYIATAIRNGVRACEKS